MAEQAGHSQPSELQTGKGSSHVNTALLQGAKGGQAKLLLLLYPTTNQHVAQQAS
jgi:hypothetical protein